MGIEYQRMMNDRKRLMTETIRAFHLPRYQELPNMGLYLEQTVKYVNMCLAPLAFQPLTLSMVSNYVKKGLIPRPHQKQYYADHMTYLYFVALAKNQMPMEGILRMILLQKETGKSIIDVYNHFCTVMEKELFSVFGIETTVDSEDSECTEEAELLHHLCCSVAYGIHTQQLLAVLTENPKAKMGDLQ